MAKELHNFDGNEVIATDLPQYLNQNFTAIPSNMGVWEKNEAVEVGDIRLLSGRENTGYVLECVASGTTGETQPVIIEEDANIVANYSDSGVVGRMRLIFNSAEKDVDEVFATGVVYSRSSYPELWEYAQLRAGLLIDEEDWQAKFMETNGKFVPYYSKGDGSTTFRTPLLGGYLKGAETSGELGEYKEAGLPPISHTHTRGTMNITGSFTGRPHASAGNFGGALMTTTSGAFTHTIRGGTASHSGITESETASTEDKVSFDASRSWTGETSNNSNVSQVYGNSDTVTPETMVGIWVIKAIGVIIDQGSTDLQDILNGVNTNSQRIITNSQRITDVESNYLPLSGGTMTGSIEITTDKALAKNKSDNKDFVRILGGTSTNDGARISLAPTYHETMPGEFWLVTGTINGKNVALIGKPNGTLTWGGNAIRFVKETYKSGTSWYRVWSDGWIEQGGVIPNSTTSVTLHKPFTNTDYGVLMVGRDYINEAQGLGAKNLTTTGFTVLSSNSPRTWRAFGF